MRSPHFSGRGVTIYQGDCVEVLAELPAESVQCVVTSPPYWGLRDYGTAEWEGGDPECDHDGGDPTAEHEKNRERAKQLGYQGHGGWEGTARRSDGRMRDCSKCGATRIDDQLGMEHTPEAFVENMVKVFREVRRVLRPDGTLWLNLGDCYARDGGTTSGGDKDRTLAHMEGKQLRNCSAPAGLKAKDLVGIPWRVAFALQADGWWLRTDIVWNKPNPMPESILDRPTRSHEFMFLLTKSERYFYDTEAVREPAGTINHNRTLFDNPTKEVPPGDKPHTGLRKTSGKFRNQRDVWTIATRPYRYAHFATFPPKLVEPCMKAGTSEHGACPECGAPWKRIVQLVGGRTKGRSEENAAVLHARGIDRASFPAVLREEDLAEHVTTGWEATCDHDLDPVPCVVLDPFWGAGTVGLVALELGRHAVGLELNDEYIDLSTVRLGLRPKPERVRIMRL